MRRWRRPEWADELELPRTLPLFPVIVPWASVSFFGMSPDLAFLALAVRAVQPIPSGCEASAVPVLANCQNREHYQILMLA